ncbi:MAG: hypothetical protein AB7T59_15330 [Hyphomonadaceae bacterium]
MGKKHQPEDASQAKRHYSFEEFRMMYESTERISERKIAFTRANSTLCIAIIAGQGVAASWGFGRPSVDAMVAALILFISLLGIVFCLYWHGQLWTFKQLNDAKFKVLKEMADHVVFPDYSARNIRSMSPFEREYAIYQELGGLTSVRGLLLPKANLAETIVPYSFLAFFAAIGLLCLFWIARQFVIVPASGL